MPRAPKIQPGEPIKPVTDSRGTVHYEVYLRVSGKGQKRKVARRRFDSIGAARAFITEAKAEVQQGQFVARDTTTLQELVDSWKAQADDVRPATRDGYLQVLKPILRDHGDRHVQSIDRPTLDRWKATWPTEGGLRRNGLSDRSMRMTRQALLTVLDYAVACKIVTGNPVSGLKLPREDLTAKRAAAARKVTAQVWDWPDLEKFVAGTKGHDLEAGFRLSCAALRRSEVLGLDWRFVNLDLGTVEVDQARAGNGVAAVDDVKAGRSRRQVMVEYLVPGTMDVLRQLWDDRGRPETGLVVLTQYGRPYDIDMYSRRFWQLADDLGLPRIRLHALRHTLNRHLEQLGVTTTVRSKILGHSPATNMEVYSVATEADVAAAAELVSKTFGKPKPDLKVVS